MSSPAVTLNYDDPVIFAVCSGECSRKYKGKKAGNYFGKAYTVRQWKRKPECDNCQSKMVAIYEVERDE